MEHTLHGDGVTGRASIWTQANAFFCASRECALAGLAEGRA